MQGSIKWAPPKGVLGDLVRSAAERAAALRPRKSELETAANAYPRPRSFSEALHGEAVRIIAEVKRSSPSKGEINPRLDVASQCRAYEKGGAAAISILTEPTRFGGELNDLSAASAATSCPLLRKDFIVDELQILEARAAGASAVLLIVRALDPSKLRELFGATVENHLYALVEIRNAGELEVALAVGAGVIGVNNRDLETLEMDDAVQSVLPLIPRSCVAVAESGYKTVADVERASAAGADAVLIGAELSRSLDPAKKLSELAAINRSRNARPN